MSRIDRTFAKLGRVPGTIEAKDTNKKGDNRSALVCFVPAGYPDIATSRAIINNLPQNGADIVEIGMPFSDASADGAEIRQASRIALQNGIRLDTILDLARDFRATNPATPLILMGYYNPIFSFGITKFVAAAKEAGVDGLIIVDLPPEEEDELLQHLDNGAKNSADASDKQDLCLIRLVTPTSDSARLKVITAKARGFLYYVSVTGVTGGGSPELQKVKEHIKQIDEHTKESLPIAVGFGIKNEEQVKDFGKLGQAVVVGSALIKTIRESKAGGDNSATTQAKLASQIKSYATVLA